MNMTPFGPEHGPLNTTRPQSSLTVRTFDPHGRTLEVAVNGDTAVKGLLIIGGVGFAMYALGRGLSAR